MDSRGQLSLDFILAALFFIAAFQIILSMSQSLEQGQSGIAVQTQMNVIAENISSKVSQKAVFEGAGGESGFSFSIPLIVAPGRPSQSCEAKILSGPGSMVSVYYPTELAVKGSEEGSKFAEVKIANPAPSIYNEGFKCGFSYNCTFTAGSPSGSWACAES